MLRYTSAIAGLPLNNNVIYTSEVNRVEIAVDGEVHNFCDFVALHADSIPLESSWNRNTSSIGINLEVVFIQRNLSEETMNVFIFCIIQSKLHEIRKIGIIII